MIDPEPLLDRLQAAEARLAAHADAQRPGLTHADARTGERWEAGQVWAHLAEFPAYWVGQLHALQAAHAAGVPQPIPFGRTRADPSRGAAIEARRREDSVALLGDVRSGIAAARVLSDSLTASEWALVGLHPTLGEMPVPGIVERFLVGHLEEHATQLDELAAHPEEA
ncbi:MAG: hypothetical protein ACRDF7_01465 [Candidatus Limnocylindrales bacterium]